MATLAALAALVLGMVEDSATKPLVVGLAAALSIWITDVRGWIRLSRTAVSLISLPMVGYFAVQMPHASNDAWLVLIIDATLCLQVLLFFQKKEIATYWQLITISLVEIVFAAGFSHGVAFGMLMVIYVMVTMSALALLLLDTQWSLHQAENIEVVVGPRPRARGDRPGHLQRQLRGQQPQRHRGRVVSPPGDARARHAPAGGLDLLHRAAAGPRAAWRGAMLFPKSLVGFSDKITLGQLGEILESHEEVNARATDRPSRRPPLSTAIATLPPRHGPHALCPDSGPNLNRTRPRTTPSSPSAGGAFSNTWKPSGHSRSGSLHSKSLRAPVIPAMQANAFRGRGVAADSHRAARPRRGVQRLAARVDRQKHSRGDRFRPGAGAAAGGAATCMACHWSINWTPRASTRGTPPRWCRATIPARARPPTICPRTWTFGCRRQKKAFRN